MIWSLIIISSVVQGPRDRLERCKQTQVHCAKDGQGYCTSAVVTFALRYSEPDPIVCLKVALGAVATIVLPANTAVGAPVYGNKATLGEPQKTDDGRILIWPTPPRSVQGAPLMLEELPSNLQIPLEEGITVHVELLLARPEDNSVRQLVLTFPEREKESDYVSKQVRARHEQLEAEYQKRQDSLEEDALKIGRRRMAQAMLRRSDESTQRAKGERGLVIVNTRRLRRFGDEMLLSFSILNRSRQPGTFLVKDVLVLGSGQRNMRAEYTGTSDEQIVVPFNEERHVMALFSADEAVSEYELHVVEDGGLGRTVKVKGISF